MTLPVVSKMDSNFESRRPHAILDADSRIRKAIKIERLLNLDDLRQPISLLDIGAGSGHMAHYFGTHPRIFFKVTAIDRIDQCQIKAGFNFIKVRDASLPFADRSFDVILSNHVIEHVGGHDEQAHHLAEIRRVLKPTGRCYLATPNRFMVIEPHYKLAFLSWLPKSWRSAYLKKRRRGDVFDCEPLTDFGLRKLIEDAGLRYQNLFVDAVHETVKSEGYQSWVLRIACIIPDRILCRLSILNPTLVYLLKCR